MNLYHVYPIRIMYVVLNKEISSTVLVLDIGDQKENT